MMVCAPFDKIAELRFPKAKHARVIERITVVETEDRGFGEKAVVNADARLIGREMEQTADTAGPSSHRKEPSADG